MDAKLAMDILQEDLGAGRKVEAVCCNKCQKVHLDFKQKAHRQWELKARKIAGRYNHLLGELLTGYEEAINSGEIVGPVKC